MAKKLEKIVVQMAVNTTAEDSEKFGNVLCQLRGVAKEFAQDMKSFRLDLSEFGGEVPEQYDGLSVELVVDPENDEQTATFLIPADFKVLAIKEEAYKPTRESIDMGSYLASLGLA